MAYLRRRLKPENRTPKPPRVRRRAEGPSPEELEHARALRLEKRAQIMPGPTLHRGVQGGSTSGEPVPKENASQSEAYMAVVRSLGYCMRCKRPCRPDFCHRDMGKGTGIKTDVREGWPGCRPCHDFVGASGNLPKQERRALELDLGAQTRAAVIARDLWPRRLPRWPA